MGLALHLTTRLRWACGRARGRSLSTTQQPPPPLPGPARDRGRPSALTRRSRSLPGPAWYSAESRSCPPRGRRRSTLSLVGRSWQHKKSRWKSGGAGGPARRGAGGLASAELASCVHGERGLGGRGRSGPGRGEPKGDESGDEAVSLSGAQQRRRSGAETCSRDWAGGSPPEREAGGRWNRDSRRRVCGLSGRKAQPSRPARCGNEQAEGRPRLPAPRPPRGSASPGSGSRGGMKNCGMQSGETTEHKGSIDSPPPPELTPGGPAAARLPHRLAATQGARCSDFLPGSRSPRQQSGAQRAGLTCRSSEAQATTYKMRPSTVLQGLKWLRASGTPASYQSQAAEVFWPRTRGLCGSELGKESDRQGFCAPTQDGCPLSGEKGYDFGQHPKDPHLLFVLDTEV